MNDLKSKYKRQIEILGLCLSQNYHSLKIQDLADMFCVQELTIKRDLNDLRTMGIDIHSTKKYGLAMGIHLDDRRVRELILQYSALSQSEDFVDKPTTLIVKRLREKALANMAILQICIDKNRKAIIDYEKDSYEVDFRREVCPIQIFRSDGYWRLLASENGTIKQFHMNKILEVRETVQTFKPLSREKIDDLFRYSWRTWLGSDVYNVKLKFSKIWAERIKPKQLMENEKMEVNKDGSVIYETTVNSLDEITSWIVSRGEGVKVLEPEELRKRVITTAESALKNYK